MGRFEEGLRHHRKQTESDPVAQLEWDTLAVGYLQCNRLPEALHASRRPPEHIQAARHHAIIVRRAGAQSDYEHAVAAVKALLDLPEMTKFEVSSTKLSRFSRAGNLQVGLDLHALSVNKYPGEALAWYNFDVTMHQGGQLDQAIQFYSRAIELDGRLTMAFFNRGLIRVRRSEHELARSDCQAAYVNDLKIHSSLMVQFLQTT